MNRTLGAISSRHKQASFIRYWAKDDAVHLSAAELNPIRQRVPNFYTVSLSAIRNLNSHGIGRLISTIRQYAILTTILLLQQPSRYQKQTWCDTLRDFFGACCPCCDFYILYMLKLTTLLACTCSNSLPCLSPR